ncbi:MAG: hypothetical protein AAGH15_03045 [Myxococcota bacterium]
MNASSFRARACPALLACVLGVACTSSSDSRDLGAPDPDAGAGDGGLSDAGSDDAGDAGGDPDGGMDAGLDGGVDAGMPEDAGLDAGVAPLALVCGTTVPVEADDDEGYGFPILSVLADGRAAATYRRVSGTPRWVGASRFDPASGIWTELPGPPLGAVSRTAVVRHGDDVGSLWYEPSGSYSYRLFEDASGAWGAVTSFTARLLTEPIAATGRGGELIAVTTDASITAELTARRWVPGTADLTGPALLDDERLRPANPTVAVDPSGQALVIWQRDFGTGWDVALQRFDGSTWLVEGIGPEPVIVAEPNALVGGQELAVAIGDDGETGLVAHRVGSGALVIATRSVDLVPARPTLGDVETITPTGSANGPIRTALTPAGDAIVVWNELVGAAFDPQLRWVIRRGGVWSAEAEDDEALSLRAWEVVATADGFVFAAATGDRMVLRRVRADGELGPWVDVGVDANGAASPMLAAEADGTVHVVWSQLDEGAARSSIFHARCD